MKMSKDSSAEYYQDNKERLQKKLMKDIFLKKKKTKSNNIFVKIYQMMKNKCCLNISTPSRCILVPFERYGDPKKCAQEGFCNSFSIYILQKN